MMWHHVEDEEAHWIPPVITEVGQNDIRTCQNNQRKIRRKITRVVLIQVESGEWIYRGRTENSVSCHTQVTLQDHLWGSLPNEKDSNCTVCCQDISENGGDMAHFTAVHKASIFSGGEPSQALEEVTVPLARWLAPWRMLHHDVSYTANFQPWVEGHLAPGSRQWKASGWSESSAHKETARVQPSQYVCGGVASWALNCLSHISNCPGEGCHASVSLI